MYSEFSSTCIHHVVFSLLLLLDPEHVFEMEMEEGDDFNVPFLNSTEEHLEMSEKNHHAYESICGSNPA